MRHTPKNDRCGTAMPLAILPVATTATDALAVHLKTHWCGTFLAQLGVPRTHLRTESEPSVSDTPFRRKGSTMIH